MSKSRRNRKKDIRIRKNALYGVLGLVVVVTATTGFLFGRSQRTEGVQNIAPHDYTEQFAGAEHVLIDVRTAGEFSGGHIEGALNIPVQELAQRIAEVPEGVPIVVYCRSGNRSGQATRILQQAGYGEIYDLGGTIQWRAAGLPLES